MEKKRIKWTLENWDIGKLKVYDKNPRIISKEGLKQLQNSFDEIGNAQPINVNIDGTILSGHARYMQLHQEGQKTVPVYVPDRELTPKQEEAVIIRMNKNVAGEWDFDALSDEWERDDLIKWGFTEEELPDCDIEKLEPQGDEDAVPELKEEPVTRKGDVWLLGKHRLMCGDSTMIDDVEKLMKGEKADMVFTDPPYGVNYGGGHNTKQREGIKNDKLRGEDLTNLFMGALANAEIVTKGKAAFYIWFSTNKSVETFAAFSELDLKVRAIICWYKVKSGLGAFMSQYIPNYEPCIYASKKKGAVKWNGSTNEKAVWELPKDSRNEYHPTQKPVALSVRAITNSSDKNDIILDCFLGSGSTLVGAEKTNRKCYGMELDEHYCDVIIKRYMDYTGRDDVTLESTGQKYDELKATRL